MYELYNEDCLEALDKLEENSVDAIITDPPYGLLSTVKRFGKKGSAPAQYGKDGAFKRLSKGFMGKEWDGTGIEYNVGMWEKCLRVLKPGGYLLSFGGCRTFHQIACAIEDAGFELEGNILYAFGSGFPKSMNIGLAIDKKLGNESKAIGKGKSGKTSRAYQSEETTTAGEYEIKEAQNKWKGWGSCLKPAYENIIVAKKPGTPLIELNKDVKYIYSAKASKRDRDEGLEDFAAKESHAKGNGLDRVCEFCGVSQLKPEDCHCETKSWVAKPKRNNHPTVKGTELMRKLVRLVTPKGGVVLDPFMGSGSTGKAVMYENLDRDANYKFIGIEKEKEYCDIAKARIDYIINKGE